MNRQVIIRPAAEADIQEARLWYEKQRIGLGGEFVDLIEQAVLALQQRAERYPFYYRGFRRVLLKRFPYKIFFRIQRNKVIVFRILHARRQHEPHLKD